MKAVLSLCDYTTRMIRPWLEAGYECYCVDLKHPAGYTQPESGLWLVGADVNTFVPKLREYAAIFAFPPCTHVAVSGSRWFQQKGLTKLIEALTILDSCRRICESAGNGTPWMIENPVSTFSSYWRKPDYTFDPCEYARYLPEEEQASEAYTKKTCLWTSGGFIMPRINGVEPVLGSKMHKLPPSEDRGDLRSETPRGFARAVYESNVRPSGRPETARGFAFTPPRYDEEYFEAMAKLEAA